MQKGVRRAQLLNLAPRRPSSRGPGEGKAKTQSLEAAAGPAGNADLKTTRSTELAGFNNGSRGDVTSSQVVRRSVFGDARMLLATDRTKAESPADDAPKTSLATVQAVHRSVKYQRIKRLFVDSLLEVAQELREKRLEAGLPELPAPASLHEAAEAGAEAEEGVEGAEVQEGSEVRDDCGEAVPQGPDLASIEQELTSTLDALFDSKSHDAYQSIESIQGEIRRCVALLQGMRDQSLQQLNMCREVEDAFAKANGQQTQVAVSLAARLQADIERMQKALAKQAEDSADVADAAEGTPAAGRKLAAVPGHCLEALGVLERMKEGLAKVEGDDAVDDPGFNKMLAELEASTYGFMRADHGAELRARGTSRRGLPGLERSQTPKPSMESAEGGKGLHNPPEIVVPPDSPSQGSTADDALPGGAGAAGALHEDFSVEASDVETEATSSDSSSDDDDFAEFAPGPPCGRISTTSATSGPASGRVSAPPTISGDYQTRADRAGRISAQGRALLTHMRATSPDIRCLSPSMHSGEFTKLPEVQVAGQPKKPERRTEMTGQEKELLQRLLSEADEDLDFGGSRRSPRCSPGPSPRGSTTASPMPRGRRHEQLKDLRWHPGVNGPADTRRQLELKPVRTPGAAAHVVCLVAPCERSPGPAARGVREVETAWASPRQTSFSPSRSPGPSSRTMSPQPPLLMPSVPLSRPGSTTPMMRRRALRVP